MQKIKVKKLVPEAVISQHATPGSAGVDLTVTSIEDHNEFLQLNFGVAVEIPEGFVGLLVPRSSITKMNVMMKNSIGIIDSDYRGELMARLKHVKFNDGTEKVLYKEGDKAVQLIVVPYVQIQLVEVDELSDTERGAGGFGSTSEKSEKEEKVKPTTKKVEGKDEVKEN